ncbi:hypothetical protein Pflav_047230 [Phytohabitans flavus]|uniref:Uncharacterized protein n=1 Tax=Phytohabitans flavus TaxID=1076124 RepID=A0A6F8XWX6_9ACTN|nr:hypothetical protein Pflav_047230 [Phytohabitans flavus]
MGDLEMAFPPNPDGPRTLSQAVELARKHGIHIGDDLMIKVGEVPKGTFARYGPLGDFPKPRVTWDDVMEPIRPPAPGYKASYWTEHPVVDPDEDRRLLRVAILPQVLESDAAILSTFAHEMHEINFLRTALSDGKSMSATAYKRLIDPHQGAACTSRRGGCRSTCSGGWACSSDRTRPNRRTQEGGRPAPAVERKFGAGRSFRATGLAQGWLARDGVRSSVGSHLGGGRCAGRAVGAGGGARGAVGGGE